jgi:hypothetical protein
MPIVPEITSDRVAVNSTPSLQAAARGCQFGQSSPGRETRQIARLAIDTSTKRAA